MEGKEYKLVEICDLITCGVAKRPEYFESGIPFLSSKNVKKNKIFFKDYNFISQEMHNELTKKNKPQRGDILYTRVGSFGEAAVIDFDDEFSVFVSLTLIKPKREIVDAYYLMQFLNSEIVQALAKRSTIGNGVQNLNVNTVREFRIVLPSLSDQIQIANILSKAETLIEQRKQSIALLDEFLKSSFLEMFGSLQHPKFDTDEIEKYSLKITDGTHLGPKFISSGVPFLLVSNIVNNEINYNTKKFISEEEYLELNKRTPIEKGDILITSVGSYGNPALVKTITRFAFQRHIAYIKPDTKKINNVYLFGALKSDFVKMQIEKVVRGAAQKTLNLAELRKLKIPVPPIELQTQFASIVIKTETLKEQYKNSLLELKNLYGSLSQQAFKGELGVTQNKTETA